MIEPIECQVLSVRLVSRTTGPARKVRVSFGWDGASQRILLEADAPIDQAPAVGSRYVVSITPKEVRQ